MEFISSWKKKKQLTKGFHFTVTLGEHKHTSGWEALEWSTTPAPNSGVPGESRAGTTGCTCTAAEHLLSSASGARLK